RRSPTRRSPPRQGHGGSAVADRARPARADRYARMRPVLTCPKRQKRMNPQPKSLSEGRGPRPPDLWHLLTKTSLTSAATARPFYGKARPITGRKSDGRRAYSSQKGV